MDRSLGLSHIPWFTIGVIQFLPAPIRSSLFSTTTTISLNAGATEDSDNAGRLTMYLQTTAGAMPQFRLSPISRS